MSSSANDNGQDAQQQLELTGRPCPICRKPGVLHYKPFCSRRCADVDLGRWLVGAYAVPVAPEETDDDEVDGDSRES
ncbi:MAG: DNA gyrase inhibitor YacG [Beijerinckiaceae bacterium]|nr:DNA gyrase inhibitor YacG [Beijerinckiaceae bacterium]